MTSPPSTPAGFQSYTSSRSNSQPQPHASAQPSQIFSPYQTYATLQSMHDVDLSTSSAWMTATVIEDDDLMFGGKPLSTWYEEDRRRHSGSSGCGASISEDDEREEENRGRRRERERRHGHNQGGK